MIPRFAPTYSYSDLLQGLRAGSQRQEIENKLQSRLRALFNIQHVSLWGSAREALYVLLKAYNRPGDVLMPAYNCIVVPEAVHFAGYSPAFVDVDCRSLSMTAGAVKRSITPGVTAVLATHLFGIPCEVEDIMEILRQHDVLVVEDAAPALGAEYRGQLVGSFGDAAIISFQSTKIVSGEVGGALLTNRDDLADRVSQLASKANTPNGSWRLFAKAMARKIGTSRGVYSAAQLSYRALRGERMFEVVSPHNEMPPGFLSRCPDFACALVLSQLDRLEWNLGRRRKIAKIYQDELSRHCERVLPHYPEGCSPAWIQFPILADDKWELYKFMQRHHIDLTWTYRYSCADSYGLNGFPGSQKAAKTVLGLPTYPSLSDEEAIFIGDTATKYLASVH